MPWEKSFDVDVALDKAMQVFWSKGFDSASMANLIEVGQARDDIRQDIEPESKAKAMLALALAIRVLGRGAFTETALNTIAAEAKQLVA